MKAQYRTCRGKAPPSCCRKTVLSLKVPAGDFIVPLRSTNANPAVQKVQGACHQPHRSPQRAHQGAVRQQPGYRHEPEPLQPSSGAAAGQVPGRSRPHDSRRPLPCPQGQRAGGRGSCHRQPGTCRGEAPPSCCARPFCHLKAPLGLSLFRCASQTRSFSRIRPTGRSGRTLRTP